MNNGPLAKHQKILFWSPGRQSFQRGTVIWVSPHHNLVALQVGHEVEFVSEEDLAIHPRKAPTEDDFRNLPPADPQDRLEQERYLHILSSAYPHCRVRSLTLFEGIRSSCQTGVRWRVFCQAAVLESEPERFLLDVESGAAWYGAVPITLSQIQELATRPWSPQTGVPNEWDALDIIQSEMAKIAADLEGALAVDRIIAFPSPVSAAQVSSPHQRSSRHPVLPPSLPFEQGL
ncbi:MAG: hypothetical protein M3Z35_11790 [Nitrospirota bacterium]|nr:hypothetical protein [Nitrospirota bacterium]